MSASRKVPATFAVWATYEEFQKGHIPDEVFGKDEYNLAVDYAQDLSKGRYPSMVAINTTYRGKRNDFARMIAASRSEYDGSWRPYARVFMTSGVTEITDERAIANQRVRNKYMGITNRKVPLVVELEQPALFDAVDDDGGKYYPPVEMEMVEDLMEAGDNDQPEEFEDQTIRVIGDDEQTVESLQKTIEELRAQNQRQSELMRAYGITHDAERDDDPNRSVTLGEAERIAERAANNVQKTMRDETKHILADALRQVAYDMEVK